MIILIILLLIIIFLLYNNNTIHEPFSGGSNIQMNSNSISPILDPYIYDIKPSEQQEYADTIAYDMNHPFDVDGDGYGVTNLNDEPEEIDSINLTNMEEYRGNKRWKEPFRCNCNKNFKEQFSCNKTWNEDFVNENEYKNVNAYIPSTDYINLKC